MVTNKTAEGFVSEVITVLSGGNTGNRVLDHVLFGEFTVANLAAVIAIAIVVFIVAKVVARALRRRLSGKVDAKNADGLVKLSVWVITIIGLLIAAPQLHIDLSGLLVAGGVITVALGFASQNTLSNLIAGVLLMIERPVSPGDVAIINGTEGYVEKISLISTQIKTYNGTILRIPNTTVFSSDITNCVSNVARRFSYNIDISYSNDANAAISIIKDIIAKHPYALVEPAPSLYVDKLGDSGITIAVNIWSPSQFWWTARTELLWEIYVALKNGGIEVPFNQLVLWYGEDNANKLREDIRSGMSASKLLHNNTLQREEKADHE